MGRAAVDAVIWQDKTALQIIEDLFADYPQANFRFEHLEGDAAASADQTAQARHVLVITDRAAPRPDLGPARFTSQHASANLLGQRDAVTAFATARALQPNAVSLGAWNYKQVSGTSAQSTSALASSARTLGALPTLEVYDGAGGYRYENSAHAERAAALVLAALELDVKRFEGQGSTRHFEAGRTFSLIDHPLYGANTSAINYVGALAASHQRADNAFTILAVEHHATNNLGAQAAKLLDLTELEHGTYKNHFWAAPAAAPVVPRFVRKPTAPGAQTALVVGLESEALTTERDHRVKLRFAWQRTDSSGTWVRIALPAAGANWGAVLVPRIGTEVAVEFIEGDIDRPIVVGQLYNGADLPPFSAGVDSGVNHPGVISGLHTQSLDASGFNQWVMDDASGQLRMRLLASYSSAELGLGHLIAQGAGSANRGAWRGSGFEGTTQGWASLRAGKGLLITASARQGSYGSAQGSQMDAAEATAQLRAAKDLGSRLGDAAKASTAQSLTSFDAGQSVDKFIDGIDVKKQGKHEGSVGGQEALKAGVGKNGRTLTDPVEAFASPVIVMDTPSTAGWASEASIASFSGQNLSIAAQGDVQQTAGHTHTTVSGQTTSLFTHQGGIKAFAANGPVSLRAHTDELKILADKDVSIVSVNAEIRINASTKIELIAGQSSVVLEGSNITFTTPGAFTAKFSGHAFVGPGGAAAELPALPTGLQQFKNWISVSHRDPDNLPMAGQKYKIYFECGAVVSGALDANGYARHDNVPDNATRVEYEPRLPEKDAQWKPLADLLSAVDHKLG